MSRIAKGPLGPAVQNKRSRRIAKGGGPSAGLGKGLFVSTFEDAEWTPIEIESLKAAIGDGLSIEEAAEVLDRKIDDVVEKCLELGLHPTGP